MTTRNLTAGEEIPSFTRETGLANWNRFAAVNDEFIPIHMDDEAGKAAGMPTAFGMGNLQWSYLHALLRDWLDGEGRIVSVACQFRSPNLKGQTVVAHGKITGIREEGDEKLVDLEVWTVANGDTTLAPGTATVALPR
jgi:acyl dehydratase